MSFNFTPATIAFVVSTLVSFLAVVVPGWNIWWANKTSDEQKTWNMIIGLVVALAVFGLGCTGFLVTLVGGCTVFGVGEALSVWVAWITGAAVGASRAPEPMAVKLAVRKRVQLHGE